MISLAYLINSFGSMMRTSNSWNILWHKPFLFSAITTQWAYRVEKRDLTVGIALLVIGVVIVALPIVLSEPYETPRSSVIFDETFFVSSVFILRDIYLDNGTVVTIPRHEPNIVNHTVYLNKGELLNIQIAALTEGSLPMSADVVFVLTDGAVEYIKQQGEYFVYNENWTAPTSANYTFRYSNNGWHWYSGTAKELVTKLWTETAYRSVLPVEVLYVGIALFIAGEGIIIYAAVRREVVPS